MREGRREREREREREGEATLVKCYYFEGMEEEGEME